MSGRLAIVLLALVPAARGQLLPGDVILASAAGLVHIRGSTVTPVTIPPLPSAVSPYVPLPVEHVPGTSRVVLSIGTTLTPTGAGAGYSLWLLDFGSSIAAPAASLLASGWLATMVDLDADQATGDVYALTSTGLVFVLPSPVTAGTVPTLIAAGQAGMEHAAAVPGGTLLVSSATATWQVGPGAVGPGTDLLPAAGSQRGAVAVDAQTATVFLVVSPGAATGAVAAFTSGGAPLGPVLTVPEAHGPVEAKVDAATATSFTIAAQGSLIQGIPFGVQSGPDNVILQAGLLGPSSSAVALGPSGGHGVAMTGVRLAVVRALHAPMNSALAIPVGQGCPGTGGLIPALGAVGLPWLGNSSFALVASGGAAGSPAFLLGAAGLAALPAILGPACVLRLDTATMLQLLALGVNPMGQTVLDAAGAGLFPMSVPSDPLYLGFRIDFQAVILDPGGLPLSVPGMGFTLTNALACRIG